jgi:hypothetical protein
VKEGGKQNNLAAGNPGLYRKQKGSGSVELSSRWRFHSVPDEPTGTEFHSSTQLRSCWLRHYATRRKVAGSISDGGHWIFQFT